MIKSPLNYVGGKFKLLPQILPLFPKKIDTFIDIFGGGFNVGINIEANTIIYNEIMPDICNIIQGIKDSDNNIMNEFQKIIDEYGLNKTNKDGYLKLREEWNNSKDRDWKKLYMLICHSFNNNIRFNKKGGFNVPFGKDRSEFNPSLRQKFIDFRNELKNKNVIIINKTFKDMQINSKFFIYADPPYHIATANYNENQGWTEQDDIDLMEYLDKVNELGGKFAMSNVLEHKGLKNERLINWSSKYKIHYLNANYNNCCYHKTERNNPTIEVLITNY